MDRKPNDGDATGFSGLDSMLSEVGDVVASVPSPKPPAQKSRGGAFEVDEHAGASASQSSASKRSSGWTVAKWFLGIVGVGVVIAVIGTSKREEAPYQPAAAAPAAAPVSAPIEGPAESPLEPVVEQDLQAPPVGTGLTLNSSQIRYCFAEKIRIGAIETVANQNSSDEVDAFNGMVSDYNSRCSHFQYRQGTLEGVRADVESRRAATEKEVKRWWVRNHLGLDAPVRPSEKDTPIVERVQPARDSSQEPSNANVAPGAWSRSSNNSVPSSQDLGVQSPPTEKIVRIPANSVPNNYAPQGWTCQSKYKQVGNECRYVEIPVNAIHNDYAPQGWTCQSKYKQVGNECRYVEIPVNAIHNDYAPQGWTCQSKYKQVGNECRYVEIPAHAVHNDYAPQGWTCQSKYKQVGNECRYVEIPVNAVHNDYAPQGWMCQSKFKQVENECWPVESAN